MNDIPFPDNVTPLRVITREPLKTFYASHIVEIPPPPEWIWDGLALRGTVILLSGDAKVGKSLLAQQMLSCGALGLDCLGRAMTKVKTFGWWRKGNEQKPREISRC